MSTWTHNPISDTSRQGPEFSPTLPAPRPAQCQGCAGRHGHNAREGRARSAAARRRRRCRSRCCRSRSRSRRTSTPLPGRCFPGTGHRTACRRGLSRATLALLLRLAVGQSVSACGFEIYHLIFRYRPNCLARRLEAGSLPGPFSRMRSCLSIFRICCLRFDSLRLARASAAACSRRSSIDGLVLVRQKMINATLPRPGQHVGRRNVGHGLVAQRPHQRLPGPPVDVPHALLVPPLA